MPARAAVQQLVALDPVLGNGPGGIGVENVYAANSVDTPPEQLFIIIKWEPTTVVFKTTGTDRISVWVHDKDRDYTRIGQALERLKTILTDAVHVSGEDGWVLTTAEWRGESPDLYDGGYETVTRFAEFDVVSRYAPS